MSTPARTARRPSLSDPAGKLRALALAGVLAVVVAYGMVLYWTATVVGGRGRLLALIVLSVVAATAMRGVEERTALKVSAAAVLVGGGWYLWAVLGTLNPLEVAWTVVVDTLSLATGSSILYIRGVDIWMQVIVPAPTFLAWYLALRGRYVPAAASAGGLLLFLSLTGDVPGTTGLLGVLGVVAAVGGGELARRGGTPERADTLAVLLAVIAVVAMTVSVVPASGLSATGATGGPGGPGAGQGAQAASGDPVDLEGTLTSDDELRITGNAELTPEVRFVVESDEPMLWRTDVYDRYTGDGWIRTGDVGGGEGQLQAPPGETESVTQRIELRSRMRSMPAGATPVEVVEGEDALGSVTSQGTLVPDRALVDGEQYVVRSERPAAGPEALDQAGTDYPDAVEEQYTELPASTPDRVGELTAEITAEAETPYQTAVVVEDYLEETKDYSLEVPPPQGDVADQFLFDMEEGYCVYYASTMAVMLRTQGIPARVAVGYNTGEQVDDGEYVVRGSDAHMWVEVYFPDVGWVTFDPTPSADWTLERQSAIQEARQEGDVQVDTPETLNASRDEESSTGGNVSGEFNGTANASPEGPPEPVLNQVDPTDPYAREGYLDPNGTNGTPQYAPEEYRDPEEFEANASSSVPSAPVGQRGPRLALLAIVFAGAVAGVSRSTAARNTVRPLRACWQRRRDPETDLERAVQRLELALAQERVDRRPEETDREYLGRMHGTVDPRVREVYEIRERARYAGAVDPEQADRAVELVDQITRERALDRFFG